MRIGICGCASRTPAVFYQALANANGDGLFRKGPVDPCFLRFVHACDQPGIICRTSCLATEGMFGGNFGGRSRSRKAGPSPLRGHDLAKEVQVTLKESYLGTKEDIGFYHFVPCEPCSGKGLKPGTSISSCSSCQGSGQIQYRQGFFSYSQACGACSGQGYTIPSPCSECSGQSRVQKFDKFKSFRE